MKCTFDAVVEVPEVDNNALPLTDKMARRQTNVSINRGVACNGNQRSVFYGPMVLVE